MTNSLIDLETLSKLTFKIQELSIASADFTKSSSAFSAASNTISDSIRKMTKDMQAFSVKAGESIIESKKFADTTQTVSSELLDGFGKFSILMTAAQFFGPVGAVIATIAIILNDLTKSGKQVAAEIEDIEELIQKVVAETLKRLKQEEEAIKSKNQQVLDSSINALDAEKAKLQEVSDGKIEIRQNELAEEKAIIEESQALQTEANLNMETSFTGSLEEMQNKVVEFKDVTSGMFDEFQTAVSDSFKTMFDSLGSDWGTFANGIENTFDTMWKNVSNIVKKSLQDMLAQELAAFAKKQAIAAKEVLLNAGIAGSSAAAKDPNPYTKIATGLLVFAGVAALVAKMSGAFAQGGIVGGTSWSGDNVLARVNSGEMILTEGQQRRLFDIANGQGGFSSGVNIQQTVNIENGSDIPAIIDALRAGTLEALEMANLTVKVGTKQSGLAV